MKKIFFIISMLFSIMSYAQQPTGYQPTQILGKWARGTGYISSDSGFFSRYRDTTLKPLPGFWAIKWVSDSAYIWAEAKNAYVNIMRGASGGGGGSYTFSSPLSETGGTVSLTTVPVTLGGTGLTSLTANRIPIGNGTSAYTNTANLLYNTTNNQLLVNDGVVNSSNYQARVGNQFMQTYDGNGSAYALNGYYNGSSWLKANTGYFGGFQFYQGQIIFMGANTGSGTFTPAYPLKADYNGVVGIGGTSISTTLGSYTGASLVVSSSGTASIGTGTLATAVLQLKAGTATASTAPFKYTSGTNLTTPENGAKEYDGTNEFITSSSVRYTLAKTLTTTSSLDFPSVIAGGTSVLTISLTGAADGDIVNVGVPIASQTAGLIWQAYVSATNTITVSVTNTTVAPIEPATATFRVNIVKY